MHLVSQINSRCKFVISNSCQTTRNNISSRIKKINGINSTISIWGTSYITQTIYYSEYYLEDILFCLLLYLHIDMYLADSSRLFIPLQQILLVFFFAFTITLWRLLALPSPTVDSVCGLLLQSCHCSSIQRILLVFSFAFPLADSSGLFLCFQSTINQDSDHLAWRLVALPSLHITLSLSPLLCASCLVSFSIYWV